MSIIVYTESWNGKFRKSTFEVVSYAAETAKLTKNMMLNKISLSLVAQANADENYKINLVT